MNENSKKQGKQKPGSGPAAAFWKDSAVVDKIKAGFSFDYTVEEVCFYAEISRAAYYRYKKQEPEIVDSWEQHSMTLSMHAKKKIGGKIMDEGNKSTDDSWGYLRVRNKDWMPKMKNEVSGPNGGPISVAMSPERQKLFDKAFGNATARSTKRRDKARAQN